MARLSLQTKKLIRQRKLAAMMLLWLDILYAVKWWFELVCSLLDFYLQKKSLNRRYIMSFYSNRENMYHLVYASDVTCIEQLRINRQAFTKLCDMLTNIGGLKETKNMLVDEQVAMTLHILAHHVRNRVIKFRFSRSGETVNRHFKNMLNAIIRLQGDLLKTPEPILENSTNSRWKWFQNCLGALDGTYIRVRVPSEDKPRYRNRNGEIATNVLAVCSQEMQFIYILPGWEGSAADGRVLRDAVSRRNGLKVPHGYYYLVDAGYTNCEGFLAPYRGQRCHLNDWRSGHHTTPREFFNMKHSTARNVIERCFGLLKLRWTILRSPSFYPIKVHNRIIMTCCLLHNYIRRELLVDPLEEGLEVTEQVPNEAYGNPITTIETSDEWSIWRDNLAANMFNEWLASR